MQSKGVFLLLWAALIHLAGIYLYTRGFLLTRLSLSEISTCPDGSCTLPASHERVVFLIIDALRFDFLAPFPPEPVSPHHHHILKLPNELTKQHPERSLLFTSFADPPTTTLQRIKGITAGSLPTFIDMGSNFGGYSILEDSVIGQMRAAGKRVAFMGDDTWTTVFPTSFDENMTHPYDSFNVEDLHTVDNGVVAHMFPLLRNPRKPWDVLIGHFLGVDHVGHRLGPDHPIMREKLEQMDKVLRDVVDLLDDDTLLILMGDHGMDRKGDHGGDTDLEVTAAMWFYSKGRTLFNPSAHIPEALLPKEVFPGASVPHRAIQQVDLVPTLSLMLGLPIPFNNLGRVIPELFWDDVVGKRYDHALRLNGMQVHRYLKTYRDSPNGGELDSAWSSLEDLWNRAMPAHQDTEHSSWGILKNIWTTSDDSTRTEEWIVLHDYLVATLATCRYLWAQFNLTLIVMGLVILALGTFACIELWYKLSALKAAWDVWAERALVQALYGTAGGALVGLIGMPYRARLMEDIEPLQFVIFTASLFSTLVLLVVARPQFSFTDVKGFLRATPTSIPVLLLLHTAAFGSNSFTVWEDRILTFFLITTLVPHVLSGISAPTSRLRARILSFSGLFAVCVRLMASSTVCREEQQPHCSVTFFASASITSPPLLVLVFALPVAVALPYFVKRVLRVSQSDKGVAGLFLPWLIPAVLTQATVAWMLEWADTSDVIPTWAYWLRPARTVLGWGALGSILLLGSSLWWVVPLCLHITTTQSTEPGKKKEVQVLGFANAYGSPYLMFWFISFGVVATVNQLTAQIMLGLAAVALIAYLELLDSSHDVRSLNAAFSSSTPSAVLELDALRGVSPSISFSEVVPLALLALHTFYATGHQSTISSIQWKSAFVLTSTVAYPISPILTVINEWGPQFLFALAVPLLALWNLTPLPQPSCTVQARRESVRAALGMMLYHSVLLLGSATASAWLRRHLMVWKIFAPRFMNTAATLLVVDVALLLGVGVGVARVADRISNLFGAIGNPEPQPARSAKKSQ